jgi:hypothetical protein
MIIVSAGIAVHSAAGCSDMGERLHRLDSRAQETLHKEVFSGRLLAVRDQAATVLKIWSGAVMSNAGDVACEIAG